MTKKLLILGLLVAVASTSAFAFEPVRPYGQKAKNIRKEKIIQKQQIENRKNMKRRMVAQQKPKTVSLLNISAGNMIYPNYTSQEGSFGLDYTVINRDSFGYRFSAGYSKNNDGAGKTIQTIPLDVSILVNHNDKRKFNLYGGAGFGYTMMQGDVNKSGINYHWLGGAKLTISRQTALFAEYKKYFLTIDSSNYDSEQVRLGVAFELG